MTESWLLGLETSSVIGLRTMKIAAGGRAAQAETTRMVSEKVEAVLALQTLALTGGLGTTAHGAATKTAHLRRRVRENQRRLSKV